MLHTDKQTDKQINTGKNIYLLAEVNNNNNSNSNKYDESILNYFNFFLQKYKHIPLNIKK